MVDEQYRTPTDAELQAIDREIRDAKRIRLTGAGRIVKGEATFSPEDFEKEEVVQ